MEENKIIINQVNPTNFEFQQYTEQDNFLISSSRLDTAFTSSTDYIEYYAYDESQTLLYPQPGDIKAVAVTSYSVKNGDTILYPAEDLENLGYDEGTFFSTYNFYRKLLSSDIGTNYYISEISSDRTEVRLNSNVIPNDLLISSSTEFIEFRELQDYFVDFLLNFGNDQQVIANNLKLDTTTSVDPSLLVKLYEPLPSQFDLKSTLWVVEEISSPEAYSVTFPPFNFKPNDVQLLKGPNYSIIAAQETGESSQAFNYNTLLNSNLTSSANQLQNILNRKEININVDYTDYNNFIHFSSAYIRLENFYYKVGLIQSSSNAIDNLPLNSGTYSASKSEISNNIERIISNLDGWEYFMYFNSGSEKSYPKQNTEPPYILFPTGSTEALTWVGSTDDSSPYYGGQAVLASEYDAENPNYLYNAIPEYLKEDPENAKYELFVDMVAQQYDNTWLYTKNLTTRFDADNRLDFGISKDLVADAIRDFGIKLYSNNFNADDLYTAFLGITPSGSTFPFPYMTGSIGGIVNTPSGYEYVDTEISASNDIIPLDNINKRLYKRIYHNLPYLLKTKGTIAGIRALITSYGVPSTILRINEFGGKDRDNYKDWDYSEDVFNYALNLTPNSTFKTKFQLNPKWNESSPNVTAPKSIQFRFKTNGIPSTSPTRYNIWVGDINNSYILLEYTGSGDTTGTYDGAVPSQSNAFGTLTFYPDGALSGNNTASIELPFFDGGWWSVQATVAFDPNNADETKAYLYSANRIDNKIGFYDSDSADANWQYWQQVEDSYLPSSSFTNMGYDNNVYKPFEGALQEVRYWKEPLSESLFFDYVMNPYSTQGNTLNSTPDNLIFRADLGTQLITSSRESIHPKITGSWVATSSFFEGGSNFILNVNASFIENKEEIFLNQVPGGIKNRISDNIKINQEVLPTGSTLSPYRSIQQQIYPSGSDPSINYLEVAFSPTDQVNDDIIAQIGAFNLGEYIGDPRQNFQSSPLSGSIDSYPQLDRLRDEYFTKYINSYDVNDFVRLIKFFDNSLFKMVKDFTPARTSLSSGVVIKQNLLERNKQAPPSMSYTTPEYSGSVKSFARNYQVPNSNKRVPGLPSSSAPQYATVSGSSIEVFSGGTGGVFEPFNNIYAAPISSSIYTACINPYINTLATDVLQPNSNTGQVLLQTSDASTLNNTMSINIKDANLQNHFNLLALASGSGGGEGNFIKMSSLDSPSNYVIWRVDRGIFYGGYGFGDSEYGEAPYGDYTNQYQFYLTVEENNLNPAAQPYPTFGEGKEVDICFTISGDPYSGLTETEISESAFFRQYPGFTQAWSESIVPGLGIAMPNELYPNESNGLTAVDYKRFDQREFYNGEFGHPIDVGINEICKAFFGQDNIPDYFFRIQWLNHHNFTDNEFLSPLNLPQYGNVWFWSDTVNIEGKLTSTYQTLNIDQNIASPSFAGPQVDFILQNLSADGVGTGTGAYIRIYSNPFVPGNKIVYAQAVANNDPTSPNFGINESINWNVNETITIPLATLAANGVTNANQDLIIKLIQADIAEGCTNKVKYIKMSDFDIYGEAINPFITDSNYVDFNLTGASNYRNILIEGYQTYFIANTSPQDDNDPNTSNAVLLIINQPPSSDAVNSFDVGFYDLTFSASGYFSYYATASGEDPNVIRATGITESAPQGYFPPVPTYPTESFFRGWGESTYYETDDDGEIFRIGSVDGFSSDTLGNFNTGSYELDNDNEVPYKKSTYPWFMNARSFTLMALSASSILGGNGQTDLQFYTGSITASSVPIGPSFEIATPPVPEEATNITFSNNTPPVDDILNDTIIPVDVNVEGGYIFDAYGGNNSPSGPKLIIQLTTTNPSLSWTLIFNNTPNGPNSGEIQYWGTFNLTYGSAGTLDGSGTANVSFYVDAQSGIPVPVPSEQPNERIGYLWVINNLTGQNLGYRVIKQTLFEGGGQGGGGGAIP